jgi:hypothetical protein
MVNNLGNYSNVVPNTPIPGTSLKGVALITS